MINKPWDFLLYDYPFIDFEFLKRYIISESVILPLSRTAAYGIAKNHRLARPSEFVRVLKVDDDYFVITSEEDYNHFWELRKIAMRNERKKKNETL